MNKLFTIAVALLLLTACGSRPSKDLGRLACEVTLENGAKILVLHVTSVGENGDGEWAAFVLTPEGDRGIILWKGSCVVRPMTPAEG